MKHSEFQSNHHWLCGLSEYFRYTEAHDEDFELIFRALYHDNKFRKRDLIINMAKKYARKELASLEEAKLEQMNDKMQSFFNIAMHSELDDYDIKARQLIGFLAWYIPEVPLLERTSRFMAYFANQDLDLPDLGDFYSRGQIKSKIWLVTELAKVLGDEPIGNVVFYGGWYNFIAQFLFEMFNVDKIYSVDLDESVVGPCKRLYAEELDDNRFIPFTADVSKLQWRDKGLWYIDHDKRDEQITEWMEGQETNLSEKRQKQIDTWLDKQEAKYAQEIESKEDEIRQGYTSKEKIREDIFKDKEKGNEKFSTELREELFKDKDTIFENYGWRHMNNFNMVINTSCEHMDNTWFEELPEGTFVVLHQNDYFENEQHSNCMKDLEDTKANYPMSEIYYEGTLDTHLYNRFMLIGRK